MKNSSALRFRLVPASLLSLLAGTLAAPCLRAADAVPANVGRGLRPLVEWQQTQSGAFEKMTPTQRKAALDAHLGTHTNRFQINANGDVVADIRLDGTLPPIKVRAGLSVLGVTIIDEYVARRPDGLDGVLTVWLPLDQAVAASTTPGVFSVLAAHRPRMNAGVVTSQGAATLHTDFVNNAGYTGSGITVGVLSNSYNRTTPSARIDVANDDLPGIGNPAGYNQPVAVLQEGDVTSTTNTDEGRAMMQIIHDLAPSAGLAFATAGTSQTTFANNIHKLRTSPKSLCDVIVDDVSFFDEPFYSDGIVAQAVDDVVTSTSLPGHQVLYYSSAGNDGSLNYEATFTPVSDASARSSQATQSNVKLGTVPRTLTQGGFQNFAAANNDAGTEIIQSVTISGSDALLVMQWDDPFVPGGITTDYNVLVFDEHGTYRPALSGMDNNFSTGEAFEEATLPLHADGTDTTFQIAITRTRGGAQRATHLRYLFIDSTVTKNTYLKTGRPTTFGHAAARNADGVAAYDVHDTNFPEPFTSYGRATIYFNPNGTRLPVPEVRQQPTMAAVDGVNTSFFPAPPAANDTDNDGFPNFFGTSAAAPHAAAVAALLLGAAGGHDSMNAAQMRSLLTSTAHAHDLDPAHSSADLYSFDSRIHVALTANGDDEEASAFDPAFFAVAYTAPPGVLLERLDIDISTASEVYDPTDATGFPFTFAARQINADIANIAGTVGASAITGQPNGDLGLDFLRHSFLPSGLLQFGVDRDLLASHAGGNSADRLVGSTIMAQFHKGNGQTQLLQGTFRNQVGTGYSPDVGYGLIDAQAALAKLLGH